MLEERQFPIVPDRVRYPGEAVAMVVAESLAAARDAAEAVEVEYDVLPAVTDVQKAVGATALWPAATDNIALDQDFGDRAAVSAAFAAADLVVEQTFRNQRIVNCQMEPRSGVASYDAANDSYTLISGSQGVHVPRPLRRSWPCPASRGTSRAGSARTSPTSTAPALSSILSQQRRYLDSMLRHAFRGPTIDFASATTAR